MNYELVMGYCVESILKSGMLLDEHDELLVQLWRPVPLRDPDYIKMYAIDASLLGAFVAATYKRNFILQVGSVVPLTLRLCRIIHEKIKIRCHIRQVSELIHSLQGIFTLLKKMSQQYRLRKADIDKLSVNTRLVIENTLSNHMLSLLISTGELIFDLILSSNRVLKEIGNIMDRGDLNFIFVINIEEEAFKFGNMTEESILNIYDRLYMLYIYVISSLLCGFGLTFCKAQWKSGTTPNFPKLFSTILPAHLQYTVRIYERLTQNFDLMCNSSNKGGHIEEVNVTSVNGPLLSCVNGLQAQIQLSLHIVIAMQTHLARAEEDNSRIGDYVADIEGLLGRCHDILSIVRYNSDRRRKEIRKRIIETVRDATGGESEEISNEYIGDLSVHDDPSGNDEEFHLSIHGSDSSNDDDNEDRFRLEYDRLLEYAKVQRVTIRELNDELRRRNYIKQDIVPVPVPVPVPAPAAVSASAKRIRTTNVGEPDGAFFEPSVAAIDANFLAQIRAAASARDCMESVFEDDAVSSVNSSDEI
ncbi:hypothetical protein Trydic_g21013 [Trypoxylus dichotomus]